MCPDFGRHSKEPILKLHIQTAPLILLCNLIQILMTREALVYQSQYLPGTSAVSRDSLLTSAVDLIIAKR